MIIILIFIASKHNDLLIPLYTMPVLVPDNENNDNNNRTPITGTVPAIVTIKKEKNSIIVKNENNINSVDIDDRAWVQCESCHKWRALPSTVNLSLLPEKWYCTLNTYDKERNRCNAAEEPYDDSNKEIIINDNSTPLKIMSPIKSPVKVNNNYAAKVNQVSSNLNIVSNPNSTSSINTKEPPAVIYDLTNDSDDDSIDYHNKETPVVKTLCIDLTSGVLLRFNHSYLHFHHHYYY